MRNKLAIAAVVVSLQILTPTISAFFHFELLRSTPASKSSLTTAPVRLQLWFSQVPAAGVSKLSLSDATGDVPLSKTVITASDKSMYADPVKALGPGRYVIHWRGAGDDGHVLSGNVAFTVSAK
jgi:methionine-rich copper-binding protein CopC